MPRSRAALSTGIRQFIAGSGGRNLNSLGSVSTKPDTFVRGWAGGFGSAAAVVEKMDG
mgnify:CR=1 FL=1